MVGDLADVLLFGDPFHGSTERFVEVGHGSRHVQRGGGFALWSTPRLRTPLLAFSSSLVLHTPGIGVAPGAVQSSSGLDAMVGNGK